VREALVTPRHRMDDLCRDANTSERNLSLFSTAETEWRRVSGMITYWMIDAAMSPGDYLDEDRHGFHARVVASEIDVPWFGKASGKSVFREMMVDFLSLVHSTPWGPVMILASERYALQTYKKRHALQSVTWVDKYHEAEKGTCGWGAAPWIATVS
jgi:hypothetical protein